MGNLYRSAVIVVALMGALLVAACQPGSNATPTTTTTTTIVTPPPPEQCGIDGVVKGEATGDGRFTYEVTVRNYDGHMGGIKMSQYTPGPVPVIATPGQQVEQDVMVADAPEADGTIDPHRCIITFTAQ
ncbi:MAG TPA: hypothetical protein VFZ58_00430 [Candidatus Saccharimonadales bacterium]